MNVKLDLLHLCLFVFDTLLRIVSDSARLMQKTSDLNTALEA